MKHTSAQFCDLKYQKMGRFLEVCLLLLLFDQEGYGYGLIEQLAQFGFSDDDINIGPLYRSLRKMEDQGLVFSVWQEASQGPKRRLYTITELGKGELHEWIPILKERKIYIEHLIQTYEEKILNKNTI